ncbi:DUF2515 family protein [Psychrobacter vallis]|uniref:DUF2515 family protein n=1 Tax=Psychrobacter vallis TaxID=248451 RepID=UPI00191AB704|nr:hypothetical protein [Psychrobacter vallis]
MVTKAKTNTTINSCTPKTCTCAELWSVSQQFCLERMSEEVSSNTYDFVDSYSVRARRIAGTYARFYLETEKNGSPNKKGRFYWMALGAFASKTVACTLEHWTLTVTKHGIAVTASDWFGQGNFWLFQDIAGWHHYYNKFGSAVFFNCIDKRNANTLVPQIKSAIDKADWAADSLPKINNLKSNNYIKRGFNEVKKFEKIPSKNTSERAIAQRQNVLIIAQHEQHEVLQPLIYKQKRHQLEIDAMGLAGGLAPEVKLFFSSNCNVPQVTVQPKYRYRGNHATVKDDPKYDKYVSKPESDILLYDYESRMNWINNAAEKFHGLMQKEERYMLGQLQAMAGWYNKPDKFYPFN